MAVADPTVKAVLNHLLQNGGGVTTKLLKNGTVNREASGGGSGLMDI